MAQHIIVVGAGIVGAAIAYRLAEGGARVTVIEAQAPAVMASGRSFGWINASFFANDDHFRLRLAAIAAHHALETDLGASLVDWSGCLCWENSGAAFEAQAAELASLDYPCEVLDRAGFAARAPEIGAPPETCLWLPGEGAADAAGMTRALLAGAARLGAKVWAGCAVRGLRLRAGRVAGIETPFGLLEADHVVLAAGTGAAALAKGAGVALPMVPRPALMLRTRPVAWVLRHIMVSPELEFRQDAEGRILAPTVAGHQGDESETVEHLPDVLADRALGILRRMLPGITLEWETVMVAERPMPEDGLPVVGASGLPGLTLAALHSGVTLGPLIGALVAGEVLRGEESALLESFRPGRSS